MNRRLSVRDQAALFSLVPLSLFGAGIAILQAQSAAAPRSPVNTQAVTAGGGSAPRTMPPVDATMPGADTFLRLSNSPLVANDPAMNADLAKLRGVVESLAKQVETLRNQGSEVAKKIETQQHVASAEAFKLQIRELQNQLEQERSKSGDLRRALDAAVAQQGQQAKARQTITELEKKLTEERSRSREIQSAADLAAEKVRVESLSLEKTQWMIAIKELTKGIDAAGKANAASMKKLLDQTEQDKNRFAGEAKTLRADFEAFQKEQVKSQSKVENQVQTLVKEVDQRQKGWSGELAQVREQLAKMAAELPKQNQKFEAVALELMKTHQAKLETFAKEQETEHRKAQKDWSEKWGEVAKVQADLARNLGQLQGLEKERWSETQKLVGTLKDEAMREKDRVQAELTTRFADAAKNLARLEKDLQTQRDLDHVRKKMEDEIQTRLRLEADMLREKLSTREEKLRRADDELARLSKELLERGERLKVAQSERTHLLTAVKTLETRVKTLLDRPRIIQGVRNLVEDDHPQILDMWRDPRP